MANWWEEAELVDEAQSGGNWWEEAELVEDDVPAQPPQMLHDEAMLPRDAMLTQRALPLMEDPAALPRDAMMGGISRAAPPILMDDPAQMGRDEMQRGFVRQPGDYSGEEWKSMSRAERQRLGLPVSPAGWLLRGTQSPQENEFQRWARESQELQAQSEAERVIQGDIARQAEIQRLPYEQIEGPFPAREDLVARAGQFGAGSTEGIAQMLGFPVEAVNSAIGGVGQLTGLWEPSQNPVGGQQFFSDLLSPFSAGVAAPADATDRILRRVGEEVGASAVGAPLALASAAGRAAPAATSAVEVAAALGGGGGAAIANEIAPGSIVAEIAGQLAGGVAGGIGASRALGMGGQDAVVTGGSMEGQRQRARDAYRAVEADRAPIGSRAATDLELGLIDRAIRSDIDPDLTPGAYGAERAIQRRINQDMTIEDVEKLRRIVSGGISPTAAPADRSASMALKDELTDYLDNLNTPTTEALREGRDATRRYRAAEQVENATTKAERRAASTGSGGNEINAIRQNHRSLIDNPRTAKSFTKSEREAIDAIVRGDKGSNALRRASRMAMSSGGIMPYLGMGGAALNPWIALPAMAGAEVAKVMGERGTRRAVDQLVKSLLDQRVMSTSQQGISPVVQALLGARAVAGAENQ